MIESGTEKDNFSMIVRQKKSSISKSGFTLLEMVITIIILSMSYLIILPFFQSVSRSPDPILRSRAVALGQAMMDEIIAKRWDENSPVGGGPIQTTETIDTGSCAAGNRIQCFEDDLVGTYTTDNATAAVDLGPDGTETPGDRTEYDDVDDYNGTLENGTFSTQTNASFNLAGYTRHVVIRYIDSNVANITRNTPSISSSASGVPDDTSDSKLIVVTVTSPTGEQFFFTSVRCNL